jgi:Ca-activated chloride channel homolog
MSIEFENQAVLFYGSLILAVICIFGAALCFKKKLPWSVLIFRSLAVLTLLMATSSPFFNKEKISTRIHVLLDVSDSNDASVMDMSIKSLAELTAVNSEVSYSAFAANTTSIDSGYLQSFKAAQSNSNVDIGATNIENAVRSLLSKEPASVILISDGYETVGAVENVITNLASSNHRVFPLVPDHAKLGENGLRISNIYAPLIAPSEKSVNIRVALSNSTNEVQEGVLEVAHDGKTLSKERILIAAHKEIVADINSDPSKEGIKEIIATFKPSNNLFLPSSAATYLSGEAREKVLVLSGSKEDARYLKSLLETQSYRVEELIGQEQIQKVTDIKEYSVVVLNNVSASMLPLGFASKVEQYVDSGGAMIMIGGNKSFGLGGYIGTPIEKALPVEMLPPQTEEKRLNVALQLIIDKSRSMAESRKLDYAKEAAIEAVKKLNEDDYIGVMGFDKDPFVVIRMSRVATVREQAEKMISLLVPVGVTRLLGSLDEARIALDRVNAGRKHMFILTDGEITDAPANYYYQMIKELRMRGITVSTVMLGAESDETMLKEMANLGGGAFYQTIDPRSLPKIFVADIKVASGEKTMQENMNYDVGVTETSEKSTGIKEFPPIRGYVQTKIKPRANLELIAKGVTKEEPLLATWKYGKGKSIAFTSDVHGRWSASWISWEQIGRFWTELIDSLRNKDGETENIKYDLKYYYQKGKLFLDLTVFSDKAAVGVGGVLVMPGGIRRNIEFETLTLGHYRAQIDSPLAGRYEFNGQVGSKPLLPVAFNLSGELFGEKKGKGYDMKMLKKLASVTGGKINPSVEDLQKQSYVSIERKKIAHYFLIVALVFLVFEILWREVLGGNINQRKFMHGH